MKITFWSPIHGQARTTSNLIALAFMMGIVYKQKCIITQTHFNYNNLETSLVGSDTKSVVATEYFQDVGVDMLARCFKASPLDKDIINNCCISFANTNISLLPGTLKNNKEAFELDMNSIILNLLRSVEKHGSLLLLDVVPGEHPVSMNLIADSDITVVNLSQSKNVIDNYFSNKLKISGKVFYIFGNYDKKSKYNIHNLRRCHKEIKSHNSSVVPYNTAYLDAIQDGKVVEFFRRYYNSNNDNEIGYFIYKVKQAARKLLRFSGIEYDKEERKEECDVFYI